MDVSIFCVNDFLFDFVGWWQIQNILCMSLMWFSWVFRSSSSLTGPCVGDLFRHDNAHF